MNTDEAREFFREASDLFPQIADVLSKSDGLAATLTAWEEVLAPVTPRDARRSLQAMLEGSAAVPQYPNDWAFFPKYVRQWCAENREFEELPGVSRDSEPHVDCPICEDRKGARVVVVNPRLLSDWEHRIAAGVPDDWHREARKHCRANHYGSLFYALFCDCKKGRESYAEQGSRFERFDRKRYFATSRHAPPTPEELREWQDNRPPVEETNAWNPSGDEYGDLIGGEYE